MPSIESKVYTVLSGSTALTALVSSSIYPELRQQADALPAVVFSRLSGHRVNSLRAYTGLEQVDLGVDVFATSVDSRRAIGDVLTTSLCAATAFTCTLQESPLDDYDDETQEYVRALEFSIWNKD